MECRLIAWTSLLIATRTLIPNPPRCPRIPRQRLQAPAGMHDVRVLVFTATVQIPYHMHLCSARERLRQAAQASEEEERERLQREREAKLAKEREEVCKWCERAWVRFASDESTDLCLWTHTARAGACATGGTGARGSRGVAQAGTSREEYLRVPR